MTAVPSFEASSSDREDLAGALRRRRGHAGELGDVDAVAAVGAALDDAVEEDDAALLLGDGDAEVAHARQRLARAAVISW